MTEKTLNLYFKWGAQFGKTFHIRQAKSGLNSPPLFEERFRKLSMKAFNKVLNVLLLNALDYRNL